MKEPVPAAKRLIDQAVAERMAAEVQYDTAFSREVALAFGVAATLLVLAGAEMFGPVGALVAMLANVGAIAAISRAKGGAA